MDIIESKTWVEWLITIGKFAFCFVPVLYILLLIPMERRGAGFMQDRQGPNRSYIKIPYFGKIRLLGYVQNMCDGTKLFFKEQFTPSGVNKILFRVAPAMCETTSYGAHRISSGQTGQAFNFCRIFKLFTIVPCTSLQ